MTEADSITDPDSDDEVHERKDSLDVQEEGKNAYCPEYNNVLSTKACCEKKSHT